VPLNTHIDFLWSWYLYHCIFRDLTGNQLNGAVPPGLLKRIQDGSISVRLISILLSHFYKGAWFAVLKLVMLTESLRYFSRTRRRTAYHCIYRRRKKPDIDLYKEKTHSHQTHERVWDTILGAVHWDLNPSTLRHVL
jgi:hypothetical protein